MLDRNSARIRGEWVKEAVNFLAWGFHIYSKHNLTKTMHMKPVTLAALASIAMFGFGCKSPTEAITEKLTEKAVEGYVNSKIDGSVDFGDGTVTYSGDGVNAAYGEGAKLPADFPTDVPVYPGASLLMASVSSKDNTASLMANSKDASSKVTAWYADALKSKGWSQGLEQDLGSAWYRQFTKDARELMVSIAGDDQGTTITVSVSAK